VKSAALHFAVLASLATGCRRDCPPAPATTSPAPTATAPTETTATAPQPAASPDKLPPGVNAVQNEMRLLHEAMRDTVSAIALGKLSTIPERLHAVHRARELRRAQRKLRCKRSPRFLRRCTGGLAIAFVSRRLKACGKAPSRVCGLHGPARSHARNQDARTEQPRCHATDRHRYRSCDPRELDSRRLHDSSLHRALSRRRAAEILVQ